MRLLGMFCAMLAWPTVALAACGGVDVRQSLTAQEIRNLDAAVAAEPFAEGTFWRATKGNQVLTLVGTVHLDDPRLTPILAGLTPLIENADLVFLEMTTTERTQLQTRLSTDPSLAFLAEGSLDTLVDPERWKVLSAEAEARGIPAAVAARFQPWYLSLVLALPPCVLAQGQPKGLDAAVEQIAAKTAVPTSALEAYDTLFKLFADEPLEVQVDLLEAAALDSALNEDMIATTLNLFFEQKPAELWHLSAVISNRYLNLSDSDRDALYASLQLNLLDERNLAWIDVLTGRSERNILAAFGAAHLFGETGVLNLLKAEGYQLDRLQLP